MHDEEVEGKVDDDVHGRGSGVIARCVCGYLVTATGIGSCGCEKVTFWLVWESAVVS